MNLRLDIEYRLVYPCHHYRAVYGPSPRVNEQIIHASISNLHLLLRKGFNAEESLVIAFDQLRCELADDSLA
jgi:hypothetical protein